MGVLFRLAARRTWRRVAVLAVAFAAFELVVGLSYTSTDRELLRRLIEGLPPAFRALASATGADLSTPAGYLGSGYFHPVALTLQAALVTSLAASVARDVEDGVAELLLARPIARWRWLAAQATWTGVALGVVVAGGFLGGFFARIAVPDLRGVPATDLALTSAMGGLVFTTLAGFALTVAGLSRSGGRVVAATAGFVLVSYALNYLAEVWSLVRPLGPLSIFHYYDPARILSRGTLDAADVSVLAVATTVLVVAAHVIAERRELTP
ncbi:MAG: hypothetical protein HYX33_03190 [Actinobacteria bacterium]|nr:hypothetical protein [Actinomycetota bacterium]